MMVDSSRPRLPSLCETCRWRKVVVSGTGSRFLLCQLSRSDPRYAKYPPQPVARCQGYAEQETPPASERGNAV